MSDFFQFKTPEESTGFLLWKVNSLWQREIKKILQEFDLSHTQFVVLATTHFLGMKDKTVTQIQISKQTGIDKMLISNILKVLLSKKLILRKEHETDTRAKIVRLTKNGENLLKKAVKAVEDFDKIFFKKLTDNDKFNVELLNLVDL